MEECYPPSAGGSAHLEPGGWPVAPMSRFRPDPVRIARAPFRPGLPRRRLTPMPDTQTYSSVQSPRRPSSAASSSAAAVRERTARRARVRAPVLVLCLVALALVMHGCDQGVPGEDWEAGGVVALVGGLVFTSPLSDPIDQGVVVILDGIIEAVGPLGEVQIPPGAERINASGLSVLAGFWNADVWIDDELIELAESGEAAPLAAALEERFTRFGFTTVVDHGSQYSEVAPLIERIQAGGVRGPRIVVTEGRVPPGVFRPGWWYGMEPGEEIDLAGMPLGDVALLPALTLASFPGEGEPEAAAVARTSEVIEAVREFARTGAPLIFGTGAGYVPEFDPALEYLFLDEAGVPWETLFGALTSEPAQRFDYGYTGLVEPGMLADIVLVDGDPSVDLTALDRVRWVLREGAVVYSSVR